MSDNSLFIIMAVVLSVYNIEPPIDEQGNVIKLTADVTSGLLSWVIFIVLSKRPLFISYNF